MNIDNIAARFDNKPGFEVATYQEVFLPLYLLNVTTTVLEKKQITPLEEYELRVIDEGFNNATAISGFLGIDRGLVVSSLSRLHRESVLEEDGTGVISLTSKGQEVLKELASIRPKEHRYDFMFDAVTRNPRRVDTNNLYRPSETKDSGIRMIPGFPQRAPESEELDRNSLNSYFREANKSAADVQLLDVKRVNSPRRKFFEKAVMLVYKSEITDDVLVRFFINGRPQEAHDEAFQKNKGLERLGIDKESMDRNDVLDYLHQLGSKGEKIVSAVKESRDQARPLLQKIIETRDLSERSKRQASIAEEHDVKDAINRELQETTEKNALAKHQLSKLPYRRLQVYEHPDVLQDSIKEAKERLAIISPWITRTVVDDEFVAELDKCLRRGVKVFIGYGIGDKNLPFGQKEAVESLEALVNRYPELFVLKELGDTHAKILIKDRDFYVVTSFNWLSFKGDPKKKFREEWGVYISDQVEVDDFFSTLELRFKDAKKTRP